MSLDGIKKFIYDTTNNNLLTSKGSFYSWNKEIYNLLLNTEYKYIKEELMNALVLHVDEGIIVHDHYKMYYNYGIDNAECNVHDLRYLNAVTEFTSHTWAKELHDLLLSMKKTKEEYMENGKQGLEDKQYENLKTKYLEILEKAKEERKVDLSTNAYKKEEINLINKLIKYCENHLLFLKKFFVPFSNNRAESDLRGIKIKQKTGKFRSVEGANIYAVIKSCLSTYSKNGINLYEALQSIFTNNPKLV